MPITPKAQPSLATQRTADLRRSRPSKIADSPKCSPAASELTTRVSPSELVYSTSTWPLSSRKTASGVDPCSMAQLSLFFSAEK